jgi:hypothetical protein
VKLLHHTFITEGAMDTSSSHLVEYSTVLGTLAVSLYTLYLGMDTYLFVAPGDFLRYSLSA